MGGFFDSQCSLHSFSMFLRTTHALLLFANVLLIVGGKEL